MSSGNLRVSGGADSNNSAIYVPSSLLPSYNDVISIMDTWAESISFVNDTIIFEAGTYGAEDAEIIIEITDESNIPPFISLKEIGGTNTLNFYTNAISTEDDLHYWGSGVFLNTEGNAQVVFDLSDKALKAHILQMIFLFNMNLII